MTIRQAQAKMLALAVNTYFYFLLLRISTGRKAQARMLALTSRRAGFYTTQARMLALAGSLIISIWSSGILRQKRSMLREKNSTSKEPTYFDPTLGYYNLNVYKYGKQNATYTTERQNLDNYFSNNSYCSYVLFK